MNYQLSEHAREILVRRNISVEWLEFVLSSPESILQDRIDPDLEHRLATIAECENRVLRVIINPQVEPPRVVTAFFDRRISRNEA